MCISTTTSFYASLVQLTAEEQAQVNNFILTMLNDSTQASLRLHTVNQAKSRDIWSGTASYSMESQTIKKGSCA